MKTFTVVLPIEVNGRIYQHGATVELDAETAALYSHALRAAEQGAAVTETEAQEK